MIKAIELDREEMNEIMEHLPESLKQKLMQMIKPDSGLGIVKKFVQQYEDDNMMDHMLSHTISNLIRKITDASANMANENKKSIGRHGLTTIELGVIIIECLKHEAKTIDEAFKDHEQKCTQGDKCGAKH